MDVQLVLARKKASLQCERKALSEEYRRKITQIDEEIAEVEKNNLDARRVIAGIYVSHLQGARYNSSAGCCWTDGRCCLFCL